MLRQTREQTSFRAYNEDGEESSNQSSVSAQCLTRTKQAFRKDDSVER
ncbi:MAG: hypothetical protein U0L43_10710 [Muribaculaceae bacterium]|nr:hypothetical protein [Muribaculaceae bacterium]